MITSLIKLFNCEIVKNSSDIIYSYIKDIEKKKFGEVFTPLDFINNKMLLDLEIYYKEKYQNLLTVMIMKSFLHLVQQLQSI